MRKPVMGTVIVVLLALAATAGAQWHVIAGEADPETGCGPKTPARICLGAEGTAHCYAPASTKDYIFGLEPEAKQVGELDGQPLVLFSATFSGCGSGTLTDYSLLPVRNGQWVNLLPPVRLTNQSELKLWNLPAISPLPVLATADSISDWDRLEKTNGQEETHFARHRYAIAAFVFDSKAGKYVQRVNYKTTKKYPGLDDVDEIQVLKWERTGILVELRRQVPGN